ncbi:helix-turn-helix transcriptional regulator [Mycobacterium asiaticum]|uniref:Transcriptional regulator n=1 Tax=Mycobacterium asiaticum TaxID=1790 RepID=A0A1A3KP91_MYCAS|nr:transcriptional regulator [Mycobacterium asiaticum]OBJ87002.1 transcriptional regulator [Mycobacterium asiaticum]ORA10130.1 transcriptional regulator [Mycobacterium asiaticum DSM 44297]
MGLQRDAAGIGALADPVRHQLYEFVCAQSTAVSRDQAADTLGIARHQAKFHLDRLTDEGLLDSDYARTGGRSGPGAGRTSKLYRRAAREIAVSLPQREYELAGRLMAAAISQATRSGEPVVEVLNDLANACGRSIGASTDEPATATEAFEAALDVLRKYGYEPRLTDDEVELANCPFHALAQEQTELACGMNLALLSGVAAALNPYGPSVRLDPGPMRCCVVLRCGPTEPATSPPPHTSPR